MYTRIVRVALFNDYEKQKKTANTFGFLPVYEPAANE